MTRRAVASYLGAIVCIAWAVLTVWAFIHGATRRDDDVPLPSDGIQPGDTHTYALMDGASWSYTESAIRH
jgi:hypothetical protein